MKTIPGTWDRTYQCYHTPYAYGTNIRVFSAIRDDLSLLSHVSIRVHAESATTDTSIELTPDQMRDFAQKLIAAAARIESLEKEALGLRQTMQEAAA